MQERRTLTRREFGREVALVAGASLLGGAAKAASNADVIDEALGLLARTGPEFGGLSNHGPMAAEALVALGRPDAVLPWVNRYRKRLQPPPSERNRITAADGWRGALGDFTRVGDLTALFDRELAAAPWRDVLARWLVRLVPGTAAVLFHGLLRTAHAARSLGRGETAPRRHELACALGYWAARFQPLPARAMAAPRGARPSQVVAGLERVPPGRNVSGFQVAVRELQALASFPPVIDRVDTSGDGGAFLSDLTAIFARTYLANADARPIAFVHGVTGPAAARLLTPFAPAEARRDLLRFTWQAAAGLYCAFAHHPPATALAGAAPAPRREDLVERAVATQDEHAIKLTEACLREHAAQPDPVYSLAAADFAARAHAS